MIGCWSCDMGLGLFSTLLLQMSGSGGGCSGGCISMVIDLFHGEVVLQVIAYNGKIFY